MHFKHCTSVHSTYVVESCPVVTLMTRTVSCSNIRYPPLFGLFHTNLRFHSSLPRPLLAGDVICDVHIDLRRRHQRFCCGFRRTCLTAQTTKHNSYKSRNLNTTYNLHIKSCHKRPPGRTVACPTYAGKCCSFYIHIGIQYKR